MAVPSEKQIPGHARLRAVLRQVTEALVREIKAPSHAPPIWTEFEWGIARAVVAIHGIAGILLGNLKWTDPAHWRAFLCAQVAEIRRQHHQLSSALGEIDTLAIDEDIPVVILKWCALHARGIYQPGERPMADIDLLVHPGDAEEMANLLQRAGFASRGSSWKHREFVRARGTESVSVDMHTRLAERLAGRVVELPCVSFGGEQGGIRGYATKAALMRHLLFHTAGNMARRWVRAIHLYDIAQLAPHLETTDWQELRSREWPMRWCLYPPLLLVSRYFPQIIPSETLAEFAATCPRFLARSAQRHSLSDISASNPNLMALPELAWCTSIGLLVRYVRLRLIPERAQLDGFRGLAETADFARDQRWFTMSHPKRIITWMFRRPIRPATLHAVRRGLEYRATPSEDGA